MMGKYKIFNMANDPMQKQKISMQRGLSGLKHDPVIDVEADFYYQNYVILILF